LTLRKNFIKVAKFVEKCKIYIFWFRRKKRNMYNKKHDFKNKISNLNIRRWRLFLLSFVDANYLIINSIERLFDDVCDYNVSTKSKLWRKISEKQDLISRNILIFDSFSNELLNVICSLLCIDFDAESQTFWKNLLNVNKKKIKEKINILNINSASRQFSLNHTCIECSNRRFYLSTISLKKDENRFLLFILYNREIIIIWLWIFFNAFIKKRRKRKKNYTCWMYEYINWFS
jgi:hypothetical protein